jgi:hypothetical protein
MKTWREQIADNLTEISNSIGVDPLLVVGIILIPIMVLRAKELKNFKNQELWEKLYDISFWIGATGFYLFYIFIKLSQ